MIAWEETRLEKLRQLWDAGLLAKEIAPQISPDCTASAVRGKIKRLGWRRMIDQAGDQAHSIHGRRGMLVLRGIAALDRAALRPLAAWPAMPGPLPGSAPKHWLERNDARECHWPVGGEGADLVSCCLPRAGRSTYCTAHLAMAHGGAWNCDAINDDQPQGQRQAA